VQKLAKDRYFMSFCFARAAVSAPNRASFRQVRISLFLRSLSPPAPHSFLLLFFPLFLISSHSDCIRSEKKMLWNNRGIWAGHSQWIIALLKAVDWNDPDAARQGCSLFFFFFCPSLWGFDEFYYVT
jgi:hypothetical protein